MLNGPENVDVPAFATRGRQSTKAINHHIFMHVSDDAIITFKLKSLLNSTAINGKMIEIIKLKYV